MIRRLSKSSGTGTILLAATLALAACGGGDDGDSSDIDQLDEQLTQDGSGGEGEGEGEGQILVDPKLAEASGNGDGTAIDTSSMNLMDAGEPKSVNADALAVECDDPQQCGPGDLQEGPEWAQRMPRAFPLFPNSRVLGAAGTEGQERNIRAATFVTRNSVDEVVDYYYTRAKKAGYDAEYLRQGKQHILGGVRESDDAAYVIKLSAADGGARVEIIASEGG